MQAAVSESRQAFHAERRAGIGGSDAPAIVGVSPWKGPLEVYAEKTGQVEPDEREEEFLELGLVLEPYVASRYQRETGRPVRLGRDVAPRGFVTHRDRPWMLAHLDGVVEDAERGLGVLEIKTTGWERDEWADGPPLHVTVQHQHAIEVAGARWGVVAVLFGAPVLHVRFHEFERDDAFLQELVAAEARFWHRVATHTPPLANHLDGRVLRKLFPSEEPSSIQLPQDAITWARERARLKTEISARELKVDELDNLLKQAIGPHFEGRLPDGSGRFTYKSVNRKAYEVAATSYRQLRWSAR
jgi:putative phage-type endonuclease